MFRALLMTRADCMLNT